MLFVFKSLLIVCNQLAKIFCYLPVKHGVTGPERGRD